MSIFDQARDFLKNLGGTASNVGRQIQTLPAQFQATGQLLNQGVTSRINQPQIQASPMALNRPQLSAISINSIRSIPHTIKPKMISVLELPQAVMNQVQQSPFIKLPWQSQPITVGQTAKYFNPLVEGGFASQGADILLSGGLQSGANMAGQIPELANFANSAARLAPKAIGKVAQDLAPYQQGFEAGFVKLPGILKPLAQEAKNFSHFDEFVKAVEPKLTQPMRQEIEDNAIGLKQIFDKFGNTPHMPVNIDRTQMSGQLLNKPQSELERLATNFVGKMPGFEKAPPTNIDVKSKINILDFLRTPENVLNKIGLGNEMAGLRKAHDTYLAELPQEIQKVTDWSKRVGKGAEVSIFRFLDGKPVKLNNEELAVANEIKDYLATWADKLKLPQDSRVSNYITHIFEKDLIQKEFDPDLAKILKENVAGSVYDPFVQQRLGKQGYIEDAWRALDAYIKRAVRKYNMDPALESVSKASDMLEPSQYDYIKRYTDSINMRPAQVDEWIDNLVKSSPLGYSLGQRPTIAVTQKARQMVYRGLLGLNPATALKNLSQGANTYAKLGEKYTTIGYAKVVQNLPKFLAGMDTELNKVGVLQDNFIEDRSLNATKKFWEKTDKGLFYMFNLAEKINRGAAYWGAKSKGLNRGMSEEQAIEYAKKIVRETQFAFGKIDAPLALSSDLSKTLGQFMSYTVKQGEFLGGMIKKRDIAGLIRYTAASMLFISTVGKALGMKPQDMIPTVRIGVPPTMQAPYGAYQVVTGQKDQYGNEADPNIFKRTMENPNLTKGLTNYLPAGGQIRKSIEGIGAYNQGASKTPSGKTRFPIEQTPGNLIKAATLGQYSLPGAQDYFNNMGKSNSQIVYEEISKQKTPQEKTQKWQELQQKGLITKDNLDEIKQQFIDQGLKITDKDRQIRNLGVKDGSRAKAIVQELNNTKSPQEKQALYQKYLRTKILTKEVQTQVNQLLINQRKR